MAVGRHAGKQSVTKTPLLLLAAFVLGAVMAALVCLAVLKTQPAAPAGDPAPVQSVQSVQSVQAPQVESVNLAKTFPSWNQDSDSLAELVDFVQNTCDPSSPDYVEPSERIATFDMDGTIISEKAPYYLDYCLLLYRVLDDPGYQADAETVDLCEQLRYYADQGTKNPDLSEGRHRASASEFAGMTPDEFHDYVGNFLDTVEVKGFDGMTYGETFYKPMLEVIAFLQDNDFDVWMVSACQREIVREVVERVGIAPDHVIANDVAYASSEQGGESAEEHEMDQDEEVVLSEPLYDGVSKTGKSLAIAREIGKEPILAFGNSSGDYGMLNYAEGNDGMGLLVVADDEEREYGDAAEAEEAYGEASAESWTTFSMRDDWATIYGDGVVKTGL